ncbi:MAG: tRNA (adenosine(37)-N6)-threonylcarbamoyltransferase complex dimerization subunit type 1 TsaB [bacterium]|nr:tRNA (adenosine(37)-N6)-threonylcarbamoyltransferase complex dimerization subunit type 1 TsaB [bacterium]
MPRRLLALESATDWLSIALAEDDDVVCVQEAARTRRHSAELLPLVRAALADVGWSVSQLDALAVSAGPGSFTSLRIGLASAKGLAFGRDWLGVGVSTLEAMALGVLDEAEEGTQVVPLLDARRGEWYAGGWRRQDGGRVAGLLEGLYDPATMASDLDGPVTFCCPDRLGWHVDFEAAGIEIAARIEGEAARPRADRVARLGLEALARGEGQPVEALSARYLRRAEAEAQRLGGPVERGEVARVAPSRE